MIPFRGTGILIPLWFLLSWLFVGFFYDERTFDDPSYGAWTLLTTTIISALHALQIIISTRKPAHGAQRRSPWHDTFALIPALIWPFLFLAGSIYYFMQ